MSEEVEEVRPATKRRKLVEEEENASSRREPPSRPAPLKMSEFLVADLEEFYKPCPSYRLPLEIGAFSHDEQGRLRMDRSQLQYYAPPVSARPHLDLRVGYEGFAPKTKNTSINPILAWIAGHGECFKPRAAHKTNGDAEAALAEGKNDATPTSGSASLRYKGSACGETTVVDLIMRHLNSASKLYS